MKSFISYLIEANLGICFFLLVYHLFLKDETDHRFNRGYLLVTLLLAIAMPLVHINIRAAALFDTALQTYWLPEGPVINMEAIASMNIRSPWLLIFLVYGAGVAFSLALLIVRLFKIIKVITYSSRISYGGSLVIELPNSKEVFSFLRFIFIGDSLQLTHQEKDQIIRHEQVHVDHYHSVDILFVNLLSILFWFNPFLKTYRNSFVKLHEFEADARSVENHEVDLYCSLLAKAALNSSGYRLANHFTNSLTLKRIEMMKSVKTKISTWKVTSIVGAAFAFCLVVGCANTKSLSSSSKDEVYDQVDELPTFGSKPQYTELFEFIANNLTYPKEAVEKGIEGKVYTKFVVEKDGTVTNVSLEKGIGHGCDEAAAQVVKSLPKWNPGKNKGKIVRTSFVIPIVFQLNQKKAG